MPTADTRRRVAITGMGIVCPLGNSVTSLWEALSAGRSGVQPLTLLPPLEDRVVYGGQALDFAGAIDDFGPLAKDTKKAIRKALKMMCRESMMAVAAAQQAVADAGFADEPMDPERSGVIFGSDYMLSPPDDFADGMRKCGADTGKFRYEEWGTTGLGEMNPLWMLKFLPNMPASHIAIFNDLRGPNNSLTMREIAGLLALREAVHTIERGHADRMIAGATGTRIHSFKTIHAVQRDELADPSADPTQASRPFDAHRTGMVIGEGAGAFVLEEREAALARGATILGEIAGAGSSMVADAHLNGRIETAVANAVTSALTAAEIEPEQLGHINAHGLSTRHCDRAEASALSTALGPRAREIPVVAAKSYFGNLGAGSCLVELAASVCSMAEGKLFKTLNFATPDAECPLAVVAEENVPAGASVLKISVTPQAQAAAVVVTRPS